MINWKKIVIALSSLVIWVHVVLTAGRYWLYRLIHGSFSSQLWPYGSGMDWSNQQQFMWLLLVPTVIFSWLQIWYWRQQWSGYVPPLP